MPKMIELETAFENLIWTSAYGVAFNNKIIRDIKRNESNHDYYCSHAATKDEIDKSRKSTTLDGVLDNINIVDAVKIANQAVLSFRAMKA